MILEQPTDSSRAQSVLLIVAALILGGFAVGTCKQYRDVEQHIVTPSECIDIVEERDRLREQSAEHDSALIAAELRGAESCRFRD